MHLHSKIVVGIVTIVIMQTLEKRTWTNCKIRLLNHNRMNMHDLDIPGCVIQVVTLGMNRPMFAPEHSYYNLIATSGYA